MHDERLMRGRDRTRNDGQELDALAQVQPVRVAVLIDRMTPDQFEGQPAFAFLDPDINQARNRGMLEASEQSRLTDESCAARRADSSPQQLHRHGLRHTVDANRSIDDTHAAAANQLQQTKSTIFFADQIPHRGLRRSQEGARRTRVAFGRRQKRRDLSQQLRLTVAALLHERITMECVHVHRLCKDPIHQCAVGR